MLLLYRFKNQVIFIAPFYAKLSSFNVTTHRKPRTTKTLSKDRNILYDTILSKMFSLLPFNLHKRFWFENQNPAKILLFFSKKSNPSNYLILLMVLIKSGFWLRVFCKLITGLLKPYDNFTYFDFIKYATFHSFFLTLLIGTPCITRLMPITTQNHIFPWIKLRPVSWKKWFWLAF